MKNKYKQHLEQFQLQKNVQYDIGNVIENYEDKKMNEKWKVGLITVMVFAFLFGIPILTDHTNVDKNPFSIKANDSIYTIEKSKLIIHRTSGTDPLWQIEGTKDKIASNPLFAPLDITVEGEEIDSITYTVEGASLYKLFRFDVEEVKRREQEHIAISPDLIPHGSLSDDSIGLGWQLSETPIAEITIPYDMQNEDDYLYGIAIAQYVPGLFTEKDDYMTCSTGNCNPKICGYNREFIPNTNDEIITPIECAEQDEALLQQYAKAKEQEKQIMKEAEESLKKGYRNMVLNVRVNYKDGSNETQKLRFDINELNIYTLQ